MTSTVKKLFNSSMSRLVVLVTNIGIGLFMLPFLVHALGDEHYGLWVLVGSVIAFYNLMDFGMANAMQRFLIRAMHGEDIDDVNIALSTSFILSSGIGILSLLVTFVIITLAPLFTASESNVLLFQITIGIIGVKVTTQLPLFSFYGVLVAKYRYDIISYVQLCSLILRTLLIVYFVKNGYGIVAIAVISSLADITGSLLIIFYARRFAPGIKVSRSNFSLDKLKEYFHFGKYIYVLMIARKIRFSLDELVVGAVVSLAAVTHYAIAGALIQYFSVLIGSVIGVISPSFNKYHKLGQWENLREILLVTTEIATYASFFIGGLIITLGQPFISIWVGDEYRDVYLALLILCISSIFINAQKPNQAVIIAIAKHKYYAIILGTEAIANLGISLLLGYYIGIYGVALGTTIPSLFNALILQPVYCCKQLNIPYRDYYAILAKGVMLGFFVFVPGYYISQNINIESYVALIVYGAVSFSVYTLLCFKIFLSKKTTSYVIKSLPHNVAPFVKLLARGR